MLEIVSENDLSKSLIWFLVSVHAILAICRPIILARAHSSEGSSCQIRLPWHTKNNASSFFDASYNFQQMMEDSLSIPKAGDESHAEVMDPSTIASQPPDRWDAATWTGKVFGEYDGTSTRKILGKQLTTIQDPRCKLLGTSSPRVCRASSRRLAWTTESPTKRAETRSSTS